MATDEFTDPTIGAAPQVKGRGEALPDFVDPTVGGLSLRSATPGPNTRQGYDVGDSPKKGAGFFETMKASLAPNVPEQIRHFSQSMGIPENRFGVVDGNIVYADEQGNYQRVTPSVAGATGPVDAFKRLGPWVASQVGPSIPTAASGGVGVAMGPTPWSVPAAMATAGVVDMGRQAISNALIDKPITDIDPLNSLGQAAMGGFGQTGGVVANKIMSRNPLGISTFDRLAAQSPATRATTAALEAEAQRRGIKLTAGQSTGLDSLLAQERQLSRFPETMDRMKRFGAEQRDQQVPAAIRQEISGISPKYGEEAIQSFRAGAKGVEDAADQARSAQASALYDEAFKANQSIGSRKIDRIIETPAGKSAFKKAVEKMQNDQTNVGISDEELTEAMRFAADLGKMDRVPGGVASGLKLRTWDYVKRSLGDVEQEALQAGRRDDARIIGNLRRDLTKELDSLDSTAAAGPNSTKPEGGAYFRARQAYAKGSEAIDLIEDGGVGFINGIEGMDRQSVVNRIFSAQNITSEGVAKARSQFAMAGKLDDWNAGLSSFLSDKLADAMKVNAGGSRGNVPGKFYANVWGDERQQAIVKAALGDPAKVTSLGKLMDVLNAASKSLPGGSPTATDLPAMTGAQTVSKGLQVVGKLASPGTYLNMGDEIVKGIDALRTPAARVKLAEAVLSGDYDKQLSRLRMMSPTSQKAWGPVLQILSGAGISTISGARTPADRAVPAMQPTYRQ